MKKLLFSKYISLLFAMFVAGFLLLMGLLSLYTVEYFKAEERNDLEETARNVNQAITAMMDLTEQDFQYLLEHESSLLSNTLSSLTAGQKIHVFITDGQGKVVIGEKGADLPASLSFASLTESTKFAREGEAFRSDLGGFFPEKKLCRVILLEKEYKTHKQRVGAVFLHLEDAKSAEFFTGLIKSFLAASLFAFGALLLFFRFLAKELILPLRKLNRAAESFAKGDFSGRLDEETGGEVTPMFRAFNQMASRVEENEKLRQTFVSNISHDLRTPLTTIGGFIQNMAAGTIPPERQGHYFKIITDEVDRLARLVQTLLETSRMTSGERKYLFAPMDLCELARITFLSFENRLEEKNLEVEFEAEPDSILTFADQDAIQQVIYNLIDNAIKFTPQNGTLSIRASLQGEKALFSVKNSGEGIPEEELRNLFDRFYKSDRSRGLDKKGMGLGLFIAKTIINAHGEEIWVESRVGDFTQFIFSLPLAGKDK